MTENHTWNKRAVIRTMMLDQSTNRIAAPAATPRNPFETSNGRPIGTTDATIGSACWPTANRSIPFGHLA